MKLETTVIVESDDDENIDSPTGTSSSHAGDSHGTEAARNLYESTSRRATETPRSERTPRWGDRRRRGRISDYTGTRLSSFNSLAESAVKSRRLSTGLNCTLNGGSLGTSKLL